MGVCDSSSNKSESMSTQDEYNSNKSNSKKNLVKNDIMSLKNNDGYLLPANLAKRDDINKYYNIQQKILGEGASGVVCVGEKWSSICNKKNKKR